MLLQLWAEQASCSIYSVVLVYHLVELASWLLLAIEIAVVLQNNGYVAHPVH